jgi:hypothetical protein
MPKYIRRVGAPIVLAAFTAFAACRSDAKKGPDSAALGTDSTLNRDLALAGRDSAAQPQLKDVPASTPAAPAPTATKRTTPERRTAPRTTPRNEPRKTAPAPTTPANTPPAPVTTASGNTVTTNPTTSNPSTSGGGAVGMIPAGTTLNTNASSKVCTGTNQVGDHVTATVESGVTGSNGATIPAGATVNMTVTQLKRSENANDPIVMEFAVNSVTFGGHTYPIEATVQSASITRVKDQPSDKTAQKVGIGAVAGAIAGRIIGKSTKATVIGGAAGAAAGAAAAAATANYQGCIDAGGSIVLKLTAPATVKA